MADTGKLAVVLPCAGRGTRLGLPYPKELFTFDRDRALIDTCFDLIQPVQERVRVIVVIGPHKMDTVRYLYKYHEQFELIFVYQQQSQAEFLGALHSTRPYFLEKNLVLLPDTVIKPSAHTPDPAMTTFSLLGLDLPFVFWVHRETDPEVLLREGALALEQQPDGLVVRHYMDKPAVLDPALNGYWGAFGFHRSATQEMLDMLEQSIVHKHVHAFANSQFAGSPAIELEASYDLGEWKAVHRFMEEYK